MQPSEVRPAAGATCRGPARKIQNNSPELQPLARGESRRTELLQGPRPSNDCTSGLRPFAIEEEPLPWAQPTRQRGTNYRRVRAQCASTSAWLLGLDMRSSGEPARVSDVASINQCWRVAPGRSSPAASRRVCRPLAMPGLHNSHSIARAPPPPALINPTLSTPPPAPPLRNNPPAHRASAPIVKAQ
jgi:hypothetical protein